MNASYVLAPEAAADIVQIWLYIKEQSSSDIANGVESVILDRLSFLARTPGAGHSREDLTEAPVKFFAVYSYLIVYRPDTNPLQIVAVLHGRRNLQEILKARI